MFIIAARAFCPGWCLQPGQKTPVPPLARLAVGPGTKATYCPGPKGSRDKWAETKACSVVVDGCREVDEHISPGASVRWPRVEREIT